ncbi:MAG: hypothetical protein AAFO89_05590 [Planctomycetota bacterium]
MPFTAAAADQSIIVQFPLSLAAVRALWRMRRVRVPSFPRPLGISISVRLGPLKLATRSV